MPNNNTSLRLLLVEDNKHDVLAFRRAFRDSQFPCKITHYTRAETALERLTADTADFDLVICDYNLPGMTGFELCKALIRQNINLPLVLLTGSGKETLAVDALKAGVNDYIVKDPHQGYLSLLPVVLPEVIRNHNERLARQRAEAKLAQRERYLAALVRVQQWLLAPNIKENHYDDILETLGRASRASRVSIFENHQERAAPLCTSQKAEWCAENIPSQLDAPRLQNLIYAESMPHWVEQLRQGEIINENVVTFPEAERKLLEDVGILAILILPILVNKNFFGFISFANCREPRAWEASEVNLLKAAASGIALWQEREQAELQLRQYTAELKARNEELDAFGHTVAHDLKNPLTALTGVAEILAADHREDENLAQYLQSIVRSGRKASSIVNELLVLSTVRKQDNIQLKPLDMTQIVDEALERLLHLIEDSPIDLKLPPTWPTALGHAPWIEEVWANYLSNAIKYGGQPPAIELGAEAKPNGTVYFWVRDNGPGLSADEQARLFTPFTQLRQARTRGHGLGLSIVRRIVEKLGGEVGVVSNKSIGGSTFYFTLPQAEVEG